MDWLEEGLAIGSIDDVIRPERLAEHGIRSVLCLNGFPNLRYTPLIWHSIELRDGHGNPPETVLHAVDILERLHAESPGALVHCMEGKSRSALIATLYLARRDGLSFDDAFERVRAIRTVARIEPALGELGRRLLSAPTDNLAAKDHSTADAAG